MTTPSAEYGIALVAAPPLKVIVCKAAEGKLLEVRYKTADGQIVALPPCTSFEIVNIDSDGVSLVPSMLDAAPKARFYSLVPDDYGGFSKHHTAEQARRAALDAIEPNGKWPEDIECTQWGTLTPIERVRQTDYEEAGGNSEFDYTCGYELVSAA